MYSFQGVLGESPKNTCKQFFLTRKLGVISVFYMLLCCFYNNSRLLSFRQALTVALQFFKQCTGKKTSNRLNLFSKFFFMTKAIFFTQLSLVGYLPILLLMFCLICLMGLPVYFIIHIVFNLLDIKIIFSRHHYANQF